MYLQGSLFESQLKGHRDKVVAKEILKCGNVWVKVQKKLKGNCVKLLSWTTIFTFLDIGQPHYLGMGVEILQLCFTFSLLPPRLFTTKESWPCLFHKLQFWSESKVWKWNEIQGFLAAANSFWTHCSIQLTYMCACMHSWGCTCT